MSSIVSPRRREVLSALLRPFLLGAPADSDDGSAHSICSATMKKSLLILSCCCGALFAQVANEPLRISAATKNVCPNDVQGCAHPSAAIVIEAQNASSKPIVGYALIAEYFGEKGNMIGWSSDVEGGYRSDKPLQPGASWKSQPQHDKNLEVDSKGRRAKCIVRIDIVLFADGTKIRARPNGRRRRATFPFYRHVRPVVEML